MLLEAAINGARTPAEHPRLPVHPEQLAAAAAGAAEAGAGAVHFHVRARDGRESLVPEDVARSVAAVRRACRAPIGISTGAWIEPDPGRRLALVRAWRVRPDFASVNFDETGAPELARALLELGVAVEAGLATAEAAERLVETDLGPRCLRVLLEPPDEGLAAALETVAGIAGVLRRLDGTTPRLLHGTGSTSWPLLAEAVRCGYDGRIGLEDTLALPDGTLAGDNVDLIKAARCGVLRAIP
jgi:uncharacterized protein (DUF849 family)